VRRRGFIATLAGALLASRVEVFGKVLPVVGRLPDAGLTLMINPAYVNAPFEQVWYGPVGCRWHAFSSCIELRQPGDPPKHLKWDGGTLQSDLPPRFEIHPGQPGYHEVPPYIAVPADKGVTHLSPNSFGVDGAGSTP
jgi:hypothetical protein